MWQKTNNKLYRKFEFEEFAQAEQCVERLMSLAKELNHHPEIRNTYTTVEVWLSTHDAGDTITHRDEAFAAHVDEIYPQEPHTPASTSASDKARLPMTIKMYADGGSRGNPGPSASGYVLLSPSDDVLVERGVYLGVTTNNQAEYQAVRLGLEDALKRGAQEVSVYLDSMLVVNQMNGSFKVRNRDLWPIHEAIRELVGKFKHVTFTHVPRELNKLADAEVNKCLDAQVNKK
jgi:ribonuclease HI/pterin-4a-carbinolamine dehydratase